VQQLRTTQRKRLSLLIESISPAESPATTFCASELENMSNPILRANVALLVLAASVGTSAAFGQTVVTLYQETFPWTDTQDDPAQDNELRNQGWCGGNAGDEFCNNPPQDGDDPPNEGGEGAISVSAGSDVTPSENINNNPQGPLVTDAFAFWSQSDINAQSFMYTQEYQPQVSQVTAVSWDQRDNGDDPTHLAFCVDGQWHVSDQFWSNNSGDWANTEVDLSSLTFFVVGPCPGTLPGGGVPTTSDALSLPSGQITAFGFWWDSNKTANSRFDNVRLLGIDDTDRPVVEPIPAISGVGAVTLALGLMGLGGFFARQRR
jgi:hypothetical protein